MPFKFLSRKPAVQGDGTDKKPLRKMDKTMRSLMTAFYIAAGASGAAMAGVAGVSFFDQEGRAAFEHCVRGGNVCAKAEMEDAQRFELRSQWHISATMLFMVFFPVATGMRSLERMSARHALRDAEQRQKMSELRSDLRKEERQTRLLEEELAALKKEIAPYRAQAEADAEKAAQEAVYKAEAARIAAATGLQNNIGISKPVTLKRK